MNPLDFIEKMRILQLKDGDVLVFKGNDLDKETMDAIKTQLKDLCGIRIGIMVLDANTEVFVMRGEGEDNASE